MTAQRFLVTGRVQGVVFRVSAVQAAERSGVTGWVRNLPGGTAAVQAARGSGARARSTVAR